MKIYIAAHSQSEAKAVAEILALCGHTITSSWLEEDFGKTGEYTNDDRCKIAERDVTEVLSSDAVVLLASPRRVAGGKFVEVGVAIGAGVQVFLLGHRENMLLWHKSVIQFNSVEDCVKRIAGAA